MIGRSRLVQQTVHYFLKSEMERVGREKLIVFTVIFRLNTGIVFLVEERYNIFVNILYLL